MVSVSYSFKLSNIKKRVKKFCDFIICKYYVNLKVSLYICVEKLCIKRCKGNFDFIYFIMRYKVVKILLSFGFIFRKCGVIFLILLLF